MRVNDKMFGNDLLYSKMSSQALYRDSPVDPELEHKSKKVSEKISETVNLIANEPSVAFFRIQEHVRKTLPQLVDTKHEVEEVQSMVQGACFDAEYATNAVKMMQSSAIHFQNIQDLLKNAMFMKQQISYEDARRKQGRISPGRSSPAIGDKKGKSSAKVAEPSPQRTDRYTPHMKRVPIDKEAMEDSAENKEVEHFMAKASASSQK